MDGVKRKIGLTVVTAIAIAVVAVDFTSWLMSALVEFILMGALLGVVWWMGRSSQSEAKD